MEKDLDKKLYNDYLNGEKQAFELLYNKYKSKIEYFIYNIVKDYQKAEDLTQDTFIYAMQNRIKENCSFKFYIYLIAKSKAFNYINLENRRNQISEIYLEKDNKTIEKDVLEVIIKEESKKELLKAIETLNEKYKNAIYLVNIEGLSYDETSKILGETMQNTKVLIHRGKKELRKKLLKKGFDEMNKVLKICLIVLCTTVCLSGVVFATYTIYEKIWKTPEKYNLIEEQKITEDDKKRSLTKEEAIQKAKDIANKLGKDFGNVTRAELIKNVSVDTMNWYIDTDNKLGISIESETGKLKQISDWSIDDTKIASTVTKQEAENVAKELYYKLGYKEGEYEIASLKKNKISEDTNLWQVDFCKKYDDIYNYYQNIRMTFIPEVKQLTILTIFDYDYEDNPIVISQDEATKLAKAKSIDLGNSEDKIKRINTTMSIEKMNAYVYTNEQNQKIVTQNENNITEQQSTTDVTSYRTEQIIRKVWVVEIEYYSEFTSINKYFVDVTTGEIIGGGSTK